MNRLLAASVSQGGEVSLTRRARDGELELRVNGVFVMDSLETTTERVLARMTLDGLDRQAGLRVLVGGLGLGFTLREVLLDRRLDAVVVAEIEPALIGWHHEGLVDCHVATDGSGVNLLGDPRVSVEAADVRAVVAAQPSGELDAVLLDVDNGPDQLVYGDNAAVYGCHFLRTCRAALTSTGVLAVWSAGPSDDLTQALRAVFADVVEQAIPVRLGNRLTTYHLYLASGSAA